ncbi:MAG: SDR family NAD(P)-dependent oxidoreductase [Labilithrix sp.]|nr:SDR family NAD(P)-dependent oxidoreductase [Labilithrix sp.]
MSDLTGKRVLVTGANTGIGRVTAEQLARRGAHVILACRSEEKARPVIEAIRTHAGSAEFLPLDLADLESVRDAAAKVVQGGEPLAVLVNNAGVGAQRGITKQGFEIHFGTNHLGHFLLTKLLLPLLRPTSEYDDKPRIVNVASLAHRQAKTIDFDAVRTSTPSVVGRHEYAVSKLANILFTKELARGRAGAGVVSVSLHPGVVASDVWRRIPWPLRSIMKLFMLSNEEGAATTLHCATAERVEDGAYYDKCAIAKVSRAADDAELAAELWKRSEAWVAPFSGAG